jgi:hypothetical protein
MRARSTPLLHPSELRRVDQEQEREHKESIDKQVAAGGPGCLWTTAP